MKVFIVTRQVVDSELTTHNVYDNCFIDAEECMKYVTTQLEKGNKVKYEVKSFSNPSVIPGNPWGVGTIPLKTGRFVCKDWSECSNPYKDCVDCPLRGTSDGITSTKVNIESTIDDVPF